MQNNKLKQFWTIIALIIITALLIFYLLSKRLINNYSTSKYIILSDFQILAFVFTIIILVLIIIFLIISNVKSYKVEVELRESKELLSTVINSFPDIVCFKDEEGRWIEANQAMLSIYDTNVAIIGKTNKELSELIPDYSEEFAECERTDAKVFNEGKTTIVEETFHQKNGGNRVFDVVKVPLFHEDGKKKGLVVLGREITERKKAEEIQKQIEESNKLVNELRHYEKIRTEFFANLSHEFRTPLNLIMSSVQMMQLMKKEINTDKNEEKLLNYTNIIKQNSYRLIRIVNNLIDITKIDAGYMDLQLSKENIVSIIEDITFSVKDYIENNGLDIVFDTEVEEKYIYCDVDKIERIMLNLISNAVKFTNKGGCITITVFDKGDAVEVSVKDSGIGIPQEKLATVFERFIQVDKSLSRNREGSGIGLSLVKSFIEMHKGTIHVKSELGNGCEFIFDLPANDIDGEDIIEKCKQSSSDKIEIIRIEFSDIYS